MTSHVSRVLRWYATILFARKPAVGAMLLAATAFAPDHGVAGLACAHVAWAAGLLFELPTADLENGLYGANGALLGLYVGAHCADVRAALFLCVGGGFLACLLTRALANTLGYWLQVPICSLPFALAAMLVSYMLNTQEHVFGMELTRHFSYSAAALDGTGNNPVIDLVASIGCVLFQRQLAPCLLVVIALVLSSRLLFFITALGWGFVRLLLAVLPLGAPGHETFIGLNAVLISIALGGAFLLPGPRTLALMLAAQCVGLALALALAGATHVFGLDFTALPFNVVVIGAFLMLQGRAYGARPFPPGAHLTSPEEAITYYRRYHDRLFHRAIALPVYGEWQIVQGFDGPETHQGLWRYGVDLAAVDEEHKRFRSSGIHCDDYFAYNAPVRSPVDGVVSAVYDGFDDNPIGDTNLKEPWGNFVIIHSAGVFVALHHLRRGSALVAPGQPVTTGLPVARVGNSGRSALPHLHVQVQLSPLAGAASIPFLFLDIVNVREEHARFAAHVRPESYAIVREAAPADEARLALAPATGLQWTMEVRHDGSTKLETWSWRWTLAGTVTVDDGVDALEYRFGTRSTEVLKYPSRGVSALNLLALALADLPYDRFPALGWTVALHGEPARPFLDPSVRVLAYVLGDVFDVVTRHEVQDAAMLRVGIGSEHRMEARFANGLPDELTLLEGRAVVLACRRVRSAS